MRVKKSISNFEQNDRPFYKKAQTRPTEQNKNLEIHTYVKIWHVTYSIINKKKKDSINTANWLHRAKI